MNKTSLGPGEAPLETATDAARKRVAAETYARNEASLRRTARRHSLCEDDADDALQRSLEILLRKAPSADPRELIRWTQTVVKHEALTIRRERERILGAPDTGGEDWVSLLPSRSEGPAEAAERREAIARSREALQALKPQELRALTLLAEGYSYAEIGEITSWSQTKINRCLAEGRERFRNLVSSSEDGRRCAELRPLLSAFCDGEAGGEEAAALREHLRACAHCRATVRAYRAAPAAAGALAPVLPLHRSLERAHDALGEIAARVGGKGAGVQATSVSGAGGAGVAAVAKVAAVCITAAGGAAACVVTGLVPSPLDPGGQPQRPALERHVEAPLQPLSDRIDYEPAPAQQAEPKAEPKPKPSPAPAPAPEAEPAPAEAEPVAESADTSAAVEYAPPPEPAPAPEPPAAESTGGDPAGEFGP